MSRTAQTSAFSTYQTYLMAYEKTGESGTPAWKKLVDIKDFPDLGSPASMLQCTTLSDAKHTYTPGIQSLDDFTFTLNYTVDDYKKLLARCDNTYSYAVFFGKDPNEDEPDGLDGKFYFNAKASVFISGAGVDEVHEAKITLAPAKIFEATAPTGTDLLVFTVAESTD